MDRYPAEHVDVCCNCRVPLDPAVDRAFAIGAGNYLCFECSIERHGVYDAPHDRWEVAPDVDGLPIIT
jgi:hypothetical protein